MIHPEPQLSTSSDSDRLAAALDRINRARRLTREDPARIRALLDGFQGLLEVEAGRPSQRGLDGSEALADLEAVLTESDAKAGLLELKVWLEPVLDRLIEGLLAFPERRLAAYGSLAPGETNHHQVSTLVGEWSAGTVTGALHDRGRGGGKGFPSFLWDAAGPGVSVSVLDSAALAGAWDRLDRFEGSDYRRILVPVEIETRTMVCNLYELLEATPPS